MWQSKSFRTGLLNRDDIGAGYSLSVVLVLPTYLFVAVFVVDLILLVNSGLALRASMQTATHSVRAWWPHRDALADEGLTLEDQTHVCVARSLVPFATTRVLPESQFDWALANQLQQTGLSDFASRRYVQKYAVIAEHLRIKTVPQLRETNGCLVTVEYDSPLWFPIAAGFLGNVFQDGRYYCTLSSEVWIPFSRSQFEMRSLGIPFSPRQVAFWP